MPLISYDLATFAAAVTCGVFVQSAAGFAGGLVIMPMMVWLGHDVPEAQAALMVSTIPQNVLGVYQFRETIEWRQVYLPAVIRFLTLPLGVATLFCVDQLPQDSLRQFVCGVVAAIVIFVLCCRPRPRESVHPGWMWLAFSTSGFFAGCTGTGGPMIVLWVQAHDWSTRRSRGFLFALYLLTIPVSMSLLCWTFGTRIIPPSINGLLLIPWLLLVSHAGLWVGSQLGRDRLRALTMTILLLVGIGGVLGPWL